MCFYYFSICNCWPVFCLSFLFPYFLSFRQWSFSFKKIYFSQICWKPLSYSISITAFFESKWYSNFNLISDMKVEETSKKNFIIKLLISKIRAPVGYNNCGATKKNQKQQLANFWKKVTNILDNFSESGKGSVHLRLEVWFLIFQKWAP